MKIETPDPRSGDSREEPEIGKTESGPEGTAPLPGVVPQYVTNIQSAQGTINIGPTLNLGSRPAMPGREERTDTGYDVGAIRRLLLAAFTPEELRRFCQDRAPLRPVVAYFGPGQGLVDMVDRVIDYCATQHLWDPLLAAVKAANPTQYARFAEGIGGLEPPPAADPLAERLAGLRQRVRRYAPPQRQEEALARLDALRQALAGPQPDLALLEATWHWFGAEVPALAGPVLGSIRAVGRQVEQSADGALWSEFQERFGPFPA